MQDRDDYIEGTTRQLRLWEETVGRIEKRIGEHSTAAHDALADKLRALRLRKRVLERRLNDAANNRPGLSWEDIRRPLEEAVSQFRTLAAELYDDAKAA